ncbi:NAD(P)/FAD-dependent oxidoreductase [Paludisphaera sp.]|uniref:NAD(P)/FAD-dependent oxidoreductase n=1 Tax=Paludisphaera sp. TaxID=2017432 RepID=UPI00301D7E7D
MSDPTADPHDVAVLGAGAAGLVAAARAAELGARVVLLEKNRKPGVKILISGGTRCNVTNARGLRRLESITGPVDPGFDPKLMRGARAIQDAFGPGGPFLGPSLRKLDVDRSVRLFEDEGVPLKVEANGKVFPLSDTAVDILSALTRRLGRSGAEVRYLAPARSITRDGEGFRIDLPDGPIRARRVVLAVGGRSFPGCGTTGDGYAIARSLGHSIVEVRPALVPLKVVPEWVPTLRGLSLPDVVASVHDAAGTTLARRREAILFTHTGLSGPAILDVSRAEARRGEADRLELRIDFHPDVPREELDRRLQAATRRGKAAVATILSADLPHRLAECVLDHCAIPRSRTGPDLSRAERVRLVAALKGIPLPIAGTLGFEKAEVCSGGVALDEVDPKTMQSLLAPGLYFAGEVLDLDGLIGGYNFQAAWSTGWLAGESAAGAD